MERVLIIGSGGKIGKKIVKLLGNEPVAVRAMLRSDEKKQELESYGAEVVIGNLEGDISHAVAGSDIVIFTAGSGGHTGADKTLLVDLWGAVKAIDCSKEQNVKRFLMISSRGADNPDRGPVVIKPYLIAKHFADDYLIRSGLSYTILRPGRLLDEPGSGKITTKRPVQPQEQAISRDDTAQAVLFCLKDETTAGRIFELYVGDELIEEALKR